MQSLLTSDQKSFYLHNGFLVLSDFISIDICNTLMAQAKKLVEAMGREDNKTVFSTVHHRHEKERYFLESGNRIRCFYEEGAIDANGDLTCDIGQAINKVGHALHVLDPVFREFSCSEKITTLLEALGVHDPVQYQSMYIFKQPHIGGEVTCHQDSTYLYIEQQPITGLWLALEEASLENGCLWAIPGGHQIPLKSRLRRDENDNVSMTVYDQSPWPLDQMIPLEVSRGSLIVLHGLLPHMSKENKSTRSRHAYTLHAGSSHYPFAADNWLQLT